MGTNSLADAQVQHQCWLLCQSVQKLLNENQNLNCYHFQGPTFQSWTFQILLLFLLYVIQIHKKVKSLDRTDMTLYNQQTMSHKSQTKMSKKKQFLKEWSVSLLPAHCPKGVSLVFRHSCWKSSIPFSFFYVVRQTNKGWTTHSHLYPFTPSIQSPHGYTMQGGYLHNCASLVIVKDIMVKN